MFHNLGVLCVAIINTFVKNAWLFTGFNMCISVKTTVLTING